MLDHFPLCIDINCNITPICDSNFAKHSKNVCNWKIAGDLEKSRYYSSTDKLLSAVDVPIDAVVCRDANCELHTQDIDCFYERIISCTKCAKNECIPSKPTQSKFKAIPGWNNYVKEHHAVARDALWWWKFYDKSRQGPIYHSMKSARARFKYALRATKRAEETARADALANDLNVRTTMMAFGRMCQRLIKHLMLLMVVLMVYPVNAIFQVSGKIISALY